MTSLDEDYPPLHLAYDADNDPERAPPDAPGSGKVPPNDIDAERAVISSVFLDGTQLAQLAGRLKPAAFYSEAHRRIFEAAVALYDAGQGVDMVTVARWLKDHDRIDQVGGVEGMAALLDASPVHSRVFQYAKIVHDLWRIRRCIATCQRVAAEGYLPIPDPEQYASAAWRDLDTIARDTLDENVGTNMEVLARTIRDISRREGSISSGLSSGFPSVDRLTGGMHPGRLQIIAGLRGRGKSTYLRQIVRTVAARGLAVALFCTEQSREETLLSMICLEGRVDISDLVNNRLPASGWVSVHEATARVGAWPIFINDTPDITPNRIIQHVRALLAGRRPHDPAIGLVAIDHLHRLSPDEDHSRIKRYDQLKLMAKRLKDFSRSESLPVLLAAQQKNLKTEKNDDPKPKAEAIAESRAVEHEADDLIFLWRRPRSKFDDHTAQPRPMLGVVTKARHGREGEVELDFWENKARFDDVAALGEARRAQPDRAHVDPQPEPDPVAEWYERDDS